MNSLSKLPVIFFGGSGGMKQPGHLFTIKVRNDQKSLKRR
jgi:hypothetical protein